jgi:hypothetical protein
MSLSGSNPGSRLSEEELADLKVVVADVLAEDTRQAMVDNFPAEQLPDFDFLQTRMSQGFVALHELRSRTSDELLSSRMVVDYRSRDRGDVHFLLVSFVVTPDLQRPDSRQSKSKGYGSYLRQKSLEISRRQNPNCFGIIAERESPREAKSPAEQSVRRASWMSRIGILIVDGLEYDIPPLADRKIHGTKSIPVAERDGPIKAADLIVSPFDDRKTIDGKTLRCVVERLYSSGYNIAANDPFLVERLNRLDENRVYNLIGA